MILFNTKGQYVDIINPNNISLVESTFPVGLFVYQIEFDIDPLYNLEGDAFNRTNSYFIEGRTGIFSDLSEINIQIRNDHKFNYFFNVQLKHMIFNPQKKKLKPDLYNWHNTKEQFESHFKTPAVSAFIKFSHAKEYDSPINIYTGISIQKDFSDDFSITSNIIYSQLINTISISISPSYKFSTYWVALLDIFLRTPNNPQLFNLGISYLYSRNTQIGISNIIHKTIDNDIVFFPKFNLSLKFDSFRAKKINKKTNQRPKKNKSLFDNYDS